MRRIVLQALFCTVLLLLPSALSAQTFPRIEALLRGEHPSQTLPHARTMEDSIVALAQAQIGRRYLFGGTRPEDGFDCSGLVRHLLSAFGQLLPRTADEQSRVGIELPRDPSALRPGDVLTFGRGRRITHVGIYVGEGRFVHASSGTGRVIETRLDANSRALPWRGARRILLPEPEPVVAGG